MADASGGGEAVAVAVAEGAAPPPFQVRGGEGGAERGGGRAGGSARCWA